MRALALAVSAAFALDARAAEVGFVYVRANVGFASGGHAALVAGETVYHLQTEGDGRYRIARDEWGHFAYVYAGLQNRPLSVAHVAVTEETRERVLDGFAREYVEQEVASARRDALASDVGWLEAWANGTPLPPLRAAGLLDPTRAQDPGSVRLRAALAPALAEAGRAFGAAEIDPDGEDLEALRERLALREALLALDGAWGLAPEASARIPQRFDAPLSARERAGLEALAAKLERDAFELLRSRRPDRGFALLLAQARHAAALQSLASNRLVLLDAFSGHAHRTGESAEAPSETLRARRADYAGAILERGRELVLAGGRRDDASWNLLESAAGLLARAEAGVADAALLDLERRRLPARARRVAAPGFAGDPRAALELARGRLARADREYRERWGYDLVLRNCITELARTSEPALAGRVPADELLGFVPFVFYERVVERLPIARVDEIASHRALELARALRESPGAWTRLRESTAFGSTIYAPRLDDGAFLLFSDDVLWRRPLYGLVNLAWATGYTAYGLAAAPFDRGARARAGLSGALWSLPELAFANVRKGTFEWIDARP